MRTTVSIVIALALSSCGSTNDAAPPTNAPTSTPTQQSTVPASSPPGDRAEVVHVFDGDSLVVAVDGTEYEIRLIGVNAPEGDECHGDEARETLEQLLDSGPLVLVADGDDSDQYGRLLRYLYVDGLNVNLALVANGDAVALQGDHSLDDDFTTISDAAAEQALGMWSAQACGSAAPTPELQIVDYVYNPGGRDEDNMNGEWVAIANTGTDRVEMQDWVLRDESTQHRYRFPDGFSIEAGNEVLVHSGCDQDTTTDLYWCASDPVWSNGGDTVILQDSNGTVVDRDRFAGEY